LGGRDILANSGKNAIGTKGIWFMVTGMIKLKGCKTYIRKEYYYGREKTY
jgi:hypothetical protein